MPALATGGVATLAAALALAAAAVAAAEEEEAAAEEEAEYHWDLVVLFLEVEDPHLI